MKIVSGIGIDLVSVKRFEERLQDTAFLERLFTPEELTYAGEGSQRAARLAGCWAAKEAVAKALGCGFGAELTWKDVEINHNQKGQPIVKLSQRAEQKHNNPRLMLSISHDGVYAIAIVIRLQ